MIEQDTIRLLRECDSGVKMGVTSIDEVMKYVKSPELRSYLEKGIEDNAIIQKELEKLLDEYHDDGKEPNVMAKSMSWIKTNVKLAVNESDDKIADLMTEGCNMGVKSLSKYLNQYKAADERSKNITERLINIEERLAVDIRKFL